MIVIYLNQTGFSYDVHSLTKAFYSREDVKVYDAEAENTQGQDTSDVTGVLHIRIAPGEIALDGWIFAETSGQEGQKTLLQDTISVPAGADRYTEKNRLKALLYRVLVAATGRTLPWGNLTGIRPVKIPMALLLQGMEPDRIIADMQAQYFVSREKAELAASIAVRERGILERINSKDSYSLYIGIPFCPSICLYCSFSSSPVGIWKDQVDRYLDALCQEIDETSQLMKGKKLTTVYMGGGTPTTLEPDQMDRLLTRLKQRFPVEEALEFTVEAGRPDSITAEKLRVLKEHGISRISVNPQTMNQKTLDVIGRRHTVKETEESFYLAREMGFDNINMDLIVGLPGEGEEEVSYTMEQVRRMDPDNVTVHSLALKRATRLHLFKDEYIDTSFRTSDEIMNITRRSCERSGLFPYYLYRQKNMAGNYENTGYARPGTEGLYNILIMEEVQSILALGAGASTKFVLAPDHIERVENVKDIRQYLERIDEMIARKKTFVESHGI